MLTLYIGNKNYSSWSLRAWLLLRQFDIAFEERALMLFTEQFRAEVGKVSAAGRVPVLLEDGFAVWDSLAIAEFVAERFPDKPVWPRDPKDRARARSICAEMHAGFGALRSHLPMNVEARLHGVLWNNDVQHDIERIVSMWSELRAEHRARGPFLFGEFGAADAFYAPVASRFVTYAVKLPPACSAYVDAVIDLPSMKQWTADALHENCFLPADEPYRRAR